MHFPYKLQFVCFPIQEKTIKFRALFSLFRSSPLFFPHLFHFLSKGDHTKKPHKHKTQVLWAILPKESSSSKNKKQKTKNKKQNKKKKMDSLIDDPPTTPKNKTTFFFLIPKVLNALNDLNRRFIINVGGTNYYLYGADVAP